MLILNYTINLIKIKLFLQPQILPEIILISLVLYGASLLLNVDLLLAKIFNLKEEVSSRVWPLWPEVPERAGTSKDIIASSLVEKLQLCTGGGPVLDSSIR